MRILKVDTNPEKVKELLEKGVEKVFPTKKVLEKELLSGKRLRLYTGIDPTANYIHMGHMVWMRKLAQFQKLGHEVIVCIGGFTAMVGDPDKKYTREPLTAEQVAENAKNYKNQASRILDFEHAQNPVQIKNNYDWLSKVTLEEWLEIMSKISLQEIMGHDMFKKRFEANQSIKLHELSYPLMQAYDSVHMDVDLQVGGTDQTFNLLTSRSLMRQMKNKEEYVMTLKLLTDPSGKKMGKTTDNAISFKDTPENVYGKVMAFSDEILPLAYELCTDAPMTEVKQIQKTIQDTSQNPMELKKKLAFDITQTMFGEDQAHNAQQHFENTVQKGETPNEIQEIQLENFKDFDCFVQTLVDNNLASSKSEVKRLVQQGGCKIDGNKISLESSEFCIKPGCTVQLGKRKYIKLVK